MKKKVVSLLLAAGMAVLAVAGCGKATMPQGMVTLPRMEMDLQRGAEKMGTYLEMGRMAGMQAM